VASRVRAVVVMAKQPQASPRRVVGMLMVKDVRGESVGWRSERGSGSGIRIESGIDFWSAVIETECRSGCVTGTEIAILFWT
jgi:hypothetical protein